MGSDQHFDHASVSRRVDLQNVDLTPFLLTSFLREMLI